MIWLLLFAITLFLIGVLLWRRGTRAQRATGLPIGEVIYTDTGAWEQVSAPLLSRRYGLVGKPDYLVRVHVDGGARGQSTFVPVEVKSRRRPPITPDAHILQLATYCLLVEDVHKVRPAYGLLHYADATLQIPFSDDLRRAVLDTAEAIRRARRVPDLHRDHDDGARCRGCGYAHACGEVVR